MACRRDLILGRTRFDAYESHISVAKRMSAGSNGKIVLLDQYGNVNNPLAHYRHTGPAVPSSNSTCPTQPGSGKPSVYELRESEMLPDEQLAELSDLYVFDHIIANNDRTVHKNAFGVGASNTNTPPSCGCGIVRRSAWSASRGPPGP